jgi:phospholipid transport system substrate-binding protein
VCIREFFIDDDQENHSAGIGGKMKAQCVIAVLLAVLLPVSVLAGEPAQVLDRYMDQVLEVFEQTSGKDKEQDVQRLKKDLQAVASEAFSYQVMARMSLGASWKRFSPPEQDEFVQLFTRLLEETYFSKIRKYFQEIKSYTRDKVTITEEIVFTSRKAEVQTEMEHQGKKVPVNYRMVKLEKGWQVYDVQVEGVSLIQNYRSQFQDLMLKHSSAEILDIVRKKIKEGGGEELEGIGLDSSA